MANVRTHFILQYYCVDTSVSEHILVVISYSVQRQGRIQGGLWGLETPPPEIYQGSQKNDVLV